MRAPGSCRNSQLLGNKKKGYRLYEVGKERTDAGGRYWNCYGLQNQALGCKAVDRGALGSSSDGWQRSKRATPKQLELDCFRRPAVRLRDVDGARGSRLACHVGGLRELLRGGINKRLSQGEKGPNKKQNFELSHFRVERA
jgi:hypothetical protein